MIVIIPIIIIMNRLMITSGLFPGDIYRSNAIFINLFEFEIVLYCTQTYFQQVVPSFQSLVN